MNIDRRYFQGHFASFSASSICSTKTRSLLLNLNRQLFISCGIQSRYYHLTTVRKYHILPTTNMTRQYLDIPVSPADLAFGLMADFDADSHPSTVFLIAGAYRDENGLPWVLPGVKEVYHQSIFQCEHE